MLKKQAALVGFESVGKSALFRKMTKNTHAIPSNMKGSTISVLKSACQQDPYVELIDLPGLQLNTDSKNTENALNQFNQSDTILLVVKSPYFKQEIKKISEELDLKGKKVAVIATHRDKYSPVETVKSRIESLLQVPVIWVDTRTIDKTLTETVIHSIRHAEVWSTPKSILSFLPDDISTENPLMYIFRGKFTGPMLALFFIFMMFLLPVLAAFFLSQWFEPILDAYLLNPLTDWVEHYLFDFGAVILTGDYGLLTLGVYSFVWAFPVVVLISISTTFTEETGFQEHITHALDPWLKKIGLSGRDLLPVITGFGCNVVAVFQSRGCCSCTRVSCISLISFGSACSYQIGATLSIFNAAQVPFLFLPYLFSIFIVGTIHTKIWNKNSEEHLKRIAPLPYIQKINWRIFFWKSSSIVKQFLLQAMPIFLIICLTATLLEAAGFIDILILLAVPVLYLFNLPADFAPGLMFSFIRKDGLLILNEGQGQLLVEYAASQIFILVYLASTLSACSVTLMAVRKELGTKTALSIGLRQILTSLISTAAITLILYVFI